MTINEDAAALCPLCGRPLEAPVTRHHLMPLSRGGKGTETVPLHKICHDKIHRVFSEKELSRYFYTFDRIREHEEIMNFIRWVRKKEPGYYDSSARKPRR